jgi:hypothetical protein
VYVGGCVHACVRAYKDLVLIVSVCVVIHVHSKLWAVTHARHNNVTVCHGTYTVTALV